MKLPKEVLPYVLSAATLITGLSTPSKANAGIGGERPDPALVAAAMKDDSSLYALNPIAEPNLQKAMVQISDQLDAGKPLSQGLAQNAINQAVENYQFYHGGSNAPAGQELIGGSVKNTILVIDPAQKTLAAYTNTTVGTVSFDAGPIEGGQYVQQTKVDPSNRAGVAAVGNDAKHTDTIYANAELAIAKMNASAVEEAKKMVARDAAEVTAPLSVPGKKSTGQSR